MAKEKLFLYELNIFRNEVFRAQKFLYTELSIKNIANKNKKILKTLNYTPTFWNTILDSLQHATFLTLGRIFDIDSKHNIHILLKIIEDNKNIFTKKSFKNRWIKSSDRNNDWLSEYLKNVYTLTDRDFRIFKKYISSKQKEYEKIYKPIRDQFGHNKYNINEDVKKLFDEVEVKKLEKFCVDLGEIYEVLWQLYHNGRGPLLPIKCKEFSTKNILNNLCKQDYPGPMNTQFIMEAKTALNLLKFGLAVEKKEKIDKKIIKFLKQLGY